MGRVSKIPRTGIEFASVESAFRKQGQALEMAG